MPAPAKPATLEREELVAMHRALYRACGLQVPTYSYAEENAWQPIVYLTADFATTTDEGRFCLQDLIDVLAEMSRLNAQRDPQYRTTMRPYAILRDPERLRDLILEVREKKRARQRPKPVVKPRAMAHHVQAIEEDPAMESEPASLTDLMQKEIARLEGRVG